jgi:hypothetical protein
VTFRPYDVERDKEATHRIWREIGWIEEGQEEAMDIFVQAGRAMVAEINGEAECLVLSTPGEMRYLDETLPFTGVTAVTTSRVARKQGFASRLTARVLAADAVGGALVAGLGMFEQGFYNQLGFGTGSYEHWVSFDPARLRLETEARVPQRVSADDWRAVHASLLARRRVHGSVAFSPPEMVQAELKFAKNGFGLGYYDGPNGELTHHLWCRARGEHGPYSVAWMSYQSLDQFLELMALLRNLGDQVRLVRMCEPPGIQLQDLIAQPFKERQITERGQFEARMSGAAYWQVRICDLVGCLRHTRLYGGPVRFNLCLSDPIARFLEDDAPWLGIAGNYLVQLGPTSEAIAGQDPSLPTLHASVGAFTRLWLGVGPASGLAVTDALAGPRELLADLERALLLPAPKVDWDF